MAGKTYKKLSLAFVITAAVMSFVLQIHAIMPIENEESYVFDYADVLFPDTEDEIQQMSEWIDQTFDVRVMVVIVRFIDDPTDDIENYAYTLYNEWKIGRDKEDNGKMIAHAWVRSGPYFVCGGTGEGYAVVARFGM